MLIREELFQALDDQEQTLVRMLDHGQNPQMACDAPRWRSPAAITS